MKKIAISALFATLLAAGSAFADSTTICPKTASDPKAGPGTSPAAGTAGTHYMMRAISPNCSANTNVAGVDGTSGAWYSVGSNSTKGKNNFAGHTNGGAVAATVACAIPGGCTKDEAETARTTANTAAGST